MEKKEDKIEDKQAEEPVDPRASWSQEKLENWKNLDEGVLVKISRVIQHLKKGEEF